MKYAPVYQCRLCGEKGLGPSLMDDIDHACLVAVEFAVTSTNCVDPGVVIPGQPAQDTYRKVHRTRPHVCPEGCIGLADLIGFEPQPD